MAAPTDDEKLSGDKPDGQESQDGEPRLNEPGSTPDSSAPQTIKQMNQDIKTISVDNNEAGELSADPEPATATTTPPPIASEPKEEKEPLYAWLVLLSTFLAMFFSYGTMFAQGVWQRYFYTNQYFGPQDQRTLAWIGSIAYTCSTGLGLFVGRTSDIVGHQWVLLFGSLLFATSWLLSSFATQVWQVMITQGLLYGLALACLLIPSGGVLVTHWTHRRALAISLSGCGGGVGGFVWPQVIQALLDNVGVAWAYRTLALISFVVLGICTAILKPKGGRKKIDKKAKFFEPLFFTSKHYWLLSAVGFSITWGYYIPSQYLPQYATDNGLTPSQGALMVSIMNIAGLLVRLVQGPLSKRFSPAVMFAGSICITSLCQFLIWPFVHNLGGIVAFALIYGTFATGGYHGFYPIVVNNAFPQLYASAIGLIYAWCAIPGLISPYICGLLFDRNTSITDGVRTTNYVPMFMLGGTMIMVAGMFAWAEVWALKVDRKGGEQGVGVRAGGKDEVVVAQDVEMKVEEVVRK